MKPQEFNDQLASLVNLALKDGVPLAHIVSCFEFVKIELVNEQMMNIRRSAAMTAAKNTTAKIITPPGN